MSLITSPVYKKPITLSRGMSGAGKKNEKLTALKQITDRIGSVSISNYSYFKSKY